MRVDLFLDERSGDFRFCEFNTDGTSAMNEDREGANALSRSATFQNAAQLLRLEPQELFEGWVDEFCAIYQSSDFAAKNTVKPTIAIVDYLASATLYEFEEFRARFETRGYRCLICDLPSLVYREGALWGRDIDPTRCPAGQSERIDAIYRRAVTGEILAELEARPAAKGVAGSAASDAPQTAVGATAHETAGQATVDAVAGGANQTAAHEVAGTAPSQGACALVQAVEDRCVCMIGGFVTHIAHCKQLFTVLHLPQTAAFLTADERAFIKRHVPYTTRLEQSSIELASVIANKDAWIIKPEDGYASQGVYAGVDYSPADWCALIDRCSHEPYIVQAYCPQYATLNTRLAPLDSSEGTPPVLESWNILTGLYLYNGRFSGIFVRAGQKGIIVGFAGGITVPTFLATYDPSANLALRTR
jgi:hypothetical protein